MKEKGITLVALVVTIVVLLILAGVSINLVLGENGLITQAQEAKRKTIEAAQNETGEIENLSQELEKNFYEGGNWSESLNMCTPKLGKNMIAVYWTDKTIKDNGKYKAVSGNEKNTVKNNISTAIEVTSEDEKFDWSEWYNYTVGDNSNDERKSRWANAKSTTDGSYFVWIPRYEYKILSGEHTSTAGKIDVQFINSTKTTADDKEGYKVHPAFTTNLQLGGWDKEIPGIWVAKYEISMEETFDNGKNWSNTEASLNTGNKEISATVRAVSKPSKYSWNFISIGTCFLNSLNYSQNSNTGSNSHLLKNSEWGAIAYFSYSQYGRNGNEIAKNNYYKDDTNEAKLTGFSQGKSRIAGTSDNSNSENLYNGTNGMLSSTTGNLYGIYDMGGGNWEYVSGIYSSYGNNSFTPLYNNVNYTINNNRLSELPRNQDSTKYVTIYPTKNIEDNDANIAQHYEDWSSMYGDAVYETSYGVPNNDGAWNRELADSENETRITEPAIMRGGYSKWVSPAGVFAFDDVTGEENKILRISFSFNNRIKNGRRRN